METKMKECPHLQKCKQKIAEFFLFICEGELEDWSQEDCFKLYDLGQRNRTQP